jgi:DNA transformation protein
MPFENSFVEDVLDRFGTITAATSRKMFGGYGIFHEGIMFALIADNELYLKVDAQSQHYFETISLPPFSYHRKQGKTFKMSYYLAPGEFFEDPEESGIWTQRSLDAAHRAAPTTKKK